MSRNNVPLQAKVNGLELGCIPNELKDLNTLELRLISLRIPFMKNGGITLWETTKYSWTSC